MKIFSLIAQKIHKYKKSLEANFTLKICQGVFKKAKKLKARVTVCWRCFSCSRCFFLLVFTNHFLQSHASKLPPFEDDTTVAEIIKKVLKEDENMMARKC